MEYRLVTVEDLSDVCSAISSRSGNNGSTSNPGNGESNIIIMNNQLLFEGRFLQPDVEVTNFNGMHRLFLGCNNPDNRLIVNMKYILPKLYKRLTVKNFATEIIGFYQENNVHDASDMIYDPNTGILVCPHVSYTNNNRHCTVKYNLYCYYNNSIADAPKRISSETMKNSSVSDGTDIVLPNFPGLHRLTLGSKNSSGNVTFPLATYCPNIYENFTLENLGVHLYSINTSLVDAKAGSGNSDTNVYPTTVHNPETGNIVINSFRFSGGFSSASSTTYYLYMHFMYNAYLFYNDIDEMNNSLH